jgi:rubrerythrin
MVERRDGSMKMSAVNSEPWKLASLDELLTIARAMEQQAIDGYVALSRRMTLLGRIDLAQVFDSLVQEETEHLQQVQAWREALGTTKSQIGPDAPEDLYDDEGAGLIAPELLSAYRAFSSAVRNEERAFMFWTYVSANSKSDEIKHAAERMAREELGHVAKLRRERRRAFHIEKARSQDDEATDLASLEAALSRQLDVIATENSPGAISNELRAYADEARARMASLVQGPFEIGPARGMKLPAAAERASPLSEFLLDRYLEIADRTASEDDARRARGFAAQLIACLRTVRGVAG